VANAEALDAAATEAAQGAPELSFRKGEAAGAPSLTAAPVACYELEAGNPASELVSLCEIGASLGRTMRLQDALAQVERSLRRLLPFESCAFFGLHPDGTVRAIHSGGSMREKLQDLRPHLGKGISGWVAAHSRPMLNTNPALEFQGLEYDLGGLTDTLAVPLRHEDRCVGALSLYAAAPVRFTESHLALLQVAAGFVAPLVANGYREEGLQDREQELVDPVTGAWRARYLSLAEAQMIRAGGAGPSGLHLLYVRLSNLSEIAVQYGTAVRDGLLERAVKALSAEIRSNDVLTHFGQDSFVLLLAGVRQEHLSRRLVRFRELLSSIHVRGACALHCEIGSARCPEEGQDILTLLQAAQRSMSGQSRENAGIPAAKSARIVEFPNAAGAEGLLD